MTVLILPPREDVNAYIGVPMDFDRASLVMGRIRAAMIENGMPLGESGVFISPEGISVDTTASQETINAAWLGFDIASYRTPEERRKLSVEQAAQTTIATLRSEAAILNSGTSLTTQQIRQGIARTNLSLALLIEYLVDRNVIETR